MVGRTVGDSSTRNVVLEKNYKEYLDVFMDIVTGEARRGYIEVVYEYARQILKKEAEQLIAAENLNEEEAKRYITISLKHEFASENGTELNAILPKMSPLNPQYLTKKQSVFQKIVSFVEKFKRIGGQL